MHRGRSRPFCLAGLRLALLALACVLGGSASAQAPEPKTEGGAPPTTETSPQPPTKPDPAFDILEYDVEGNSVLSTRDIERAVTPFLGPQRHFTDIEAARHALELAYQKAGFQTVFVDIPEQRIVGGVIRLHVLEGKIGQRQVSGARYYEPDQIRAATPELAPGSVPDFNQMQRELTELNKGPDRTVAPILTPGRTPGTVDVNLSVKDQLPLHGDIEDDNHASPFTRPDRLNASLHYDNLWQMQHSLALNYQVAPQDPAETNVLYATYLWRFRDSDDVLSMYAIRSNSDVAVVGSSTILGNSKIAGARYIVSLGSSIGGVGSVSYLHSFTFGLDRKDFAQTDISAQAADITVLPPITYYPVSLNYSGTLVDDGGSEQLSFGFLTAPRGIFGNTDEKFQSRRVLGGASFVTWKLDTSADRNLSKHWGAFAHLTGQWTDEPLIPNEQFVTGGADTVRGYRESEISGDRGFQGTLEARYFPLGHPGLDGKRSLYVEAFLDGAQVHLVDPAGPQISMTSIASTGVGLHARGWNGWYTALDVAKALRNGGSGVHGPITPEGTVRVEAGVGYNF